MALGIYNIGTQLHMDKMLKLVNMYLTRPIYNLALDRSRFSSSVSLLWTP